jgi:hypothetical protein
VTRDSAGNAGQDVSDAPFALFDLATPTRLTFFEARSVADGIEVRWELADGALPAPALERATDVSGPWSAIAPRTRSEGAVMVAVDASVIPGGVYWYRLTIPGIGGPVTLGILSAVVERASDLEIGLAPNPVAGSFA